MPIKSGLGCSKEDTLYNHSQPVIKEIQGINYGKGGAQGVQLTHFHEDWTSICGNRRVRQGVDCGLFTVFEYNNCMEVESRDSCKRFRFGGDNDPWKKLVLYKI